VVVADQAEIQQLSQVREVLEAVGQMRLEMQTQAAVVALPEQRVQMDMQAALVWSSSNILTP
jgi:hypothetical protein